MILFEICLNCKITKHTDYDFVLIIKHTDNDFVLIVKCADYDSLWMLKLQNTQIMIVFELQNYKTYRSRFCLNNKIIKHTDHDFVLAIKYEDYDSAGTVKLWKI